MGSGIHGISVVLYQKTQTGTDAANEPVYTETPVLVPDVLVAPASGDEVVDGERLQGRKAVYTLGIPKGDEHEWEGCRVSFWGEDYQVIGKPTQGIEANMTRLRWNKHVEVARYE